MTLEPARPAAGDPRQRVDAAAVLRPRVAVDARLRHRRGRAALAVGAAGHGDDRRRLGARAAAGRRARRPRGGGARRVQPDARLVQPGGARLRAAGAARRAVGAAVAARAGGAARGASACWPGERVAALALATHYYAIFLIAPQAVWLALRAPGWRERATALALPALAGAALAPLALGQRANDSASFIGDSALLTRLAQVPKQFLVGYDAPLEPLLVAVSALAVVAGFAGLAALLVRPPRRRRVPRARAYRWGADRRAGRRSRSLLPVLGALAGEDHLITRNVLAALPLVCALAGAGLAALARIAPRPAGLAAAAACAGRNGRRRRRGAQPAAAARRLARGRRLARADHRAAAHRGHAGVGARAAALLPAAAAARAAAAAADGEIDYIALPERRPGKRADAAPAGRAGRARAGLRARRPDRRRDVHRAALARSRAARGARHAVGRAWTARPARC